MSKIQYVVGDATSPIGSGKKIIVHIVNDKGAWGSGFVMALSNKWSMSEEAYRAMSERVLGTIDMVQVEEDISVANMIAQHDIKFGFMKGFMIPMPPIRYDAVRKGLIAVNNIAKEIGASVHMPRIGTDRAGGKWEEIEKIIWNTMSVPVVVYDLDKKEDSPFK